MELDNYSFLQVVIFSNRSKHSFLYKSVKLNMFFPKKKKSEKKDHSKIAPRVGFHVVS